ncbi:hypothetical protein L7F22_019787 [Adiantum nelumboides]|nr:hypothetical protein [Adiantum nelumboides]
MSNEAAAGHAFSNSSSSNGGPLFAPLRHPSPPQSSPGTFQNSTNNASTQSPSTRIVGGFDGALMESNSTENTTVDTSLPAGMYPTFERINVYGSRKSRICFLKKRAVIEDIWKEYAQVGKATGDAYGASEAKAGSYVSSWQSLMRTHEVLGDSRIRFAQKLIEISDDLANLSKEVDKNRKYARDTGNRLERNLLDAESSVEKSRNRFDSAAEDLERLLLLKSGESAKGGELHGTVPLPDLLLLGNSSLVKTVPLQKRTSSAIRIVDPNTKAAVEFKSTPKKEVPSTPGTPVPAPATPSTPNVAPVASSAAAPTIPPVAALTGSPAPPARQVRAKAEEAKRLKEEKAASENQLKAKEEAEKKAKEDGEKSHSAKSQDGADVEKSSSDVPEINSKVKAETVVASLESQDQGKK